MFVCFEDGGVFPFGYVFFLLLGFSSVQFRPLDPDAYFLMYAAVCAVVYGCHRDADAAARLSAMVVLPVSPCVVKVCGSHDRECICKRQLISQTAER